MAPWFDEAWPSYVPVAERRKQAAREAEKLRKKGHPVAPVVLEGRTIARTFWGKASGKTVRVHCLDRRRPHDINILRAQGLEIGCEAAWITCKVFMRRKLCRIDKD